MTDDCVNVPAGNVRKTYGKRAGLRQSNVRSWWFSRTRLPLAILFLTALCDQISKYVIVSHWHPGAHLVVIPNFFHIVHVRNTGAAWGMFRGQTIPLAVLSILVFAFIWWRFRHLAGGHAERAAGLSLVCGGIVGNLIDRLFRGDVVDFLLFYYRDFQWPAFNVADSAICVGVAIFVISSFFNPEYDAE
ncbi:MAG: signal peptidase II [Candidatus Pacebacteria bacterium]|nr:signal peptidase II [Candidatus Paceibacterota bacterium]